jgi:hypothetical protein
LTTLRADYVAGGWANVFAMAKPYALALAWSLMIFGSLAPGSIPRAGAAAAESTTDAGKTPPRVEARSADLLAVGIVRDDRMVIHLSRLVDNAPVRDAVLTVLLRGVVHPTVAEADGSFTVQSKDLGLEGAAVVVFQVAQGNVRQELKGTLEIAGSADKTEDKNSARQLGWWVLNFAVCIGFLMLLSRRRKAAAARGE